MWWVNFCKTAALYVKVHQRSPRRRCTPWTYSSALKASRHVPRHPYRILFMFGFHIPFHIIRAQTNTATLCFSHPQNALVTCQQWRFHYDLAWAIWQYQYTNQMFVCKMHYLLNMSTFVLFLLSIILVIASCKIFFSFSCDLPCDISHSLIYQLIES